MKKIISIMLRICIAVSVIFSMITLMFPAVIISDFLLAIGNTLVSVIIGHIGAAFVAANAIMAQVMRMSTVFTQGVGSGYFIPVAVIRTFGIFYRYSSALFSIYRVCIIEVGLGA